MTSEPQALRPSDWDAWYDRLLNAFGAVEAEEERALYRELTETDRSLGVWDDGEVVGTAGALSFRLSVPGGAVLPVAAVTMVHVTASHRRRGVLRSLMRRQLDDIRERGTEPLVVLTASEPDIYGRFGYGLATRHLNADVDTTRAFLRVPPEADAVRLRLVDDPGSVRAACEAVYARRVTARPGMLKRAPRWDRVPLLDPPQDREGAAPLRCVLAERPGDGEVTGYARYAVLPGWNDLGAPQGTVLLRDMEALDPGAYGALWRYLFGIDLTTTLRVRGRPVDDPWLHMVNDVRQCGLRWRDGLFVRPMEVGAALAGRAYATPVDVVFEVADDFCPWNAGRWRLSGDAKGASCARTRDAADLSLSVRELGAAYLGGESLSSLALAGRVREAREGSGALREASVAFGSDLAPWLPHNF